MKLLKFLPAVLLALLAASGAMADEAAKKELAPNGKLRVAIGVSPAPSAFYSTKDESGKFRGVTVDLGASLATKLGVPVEYVPYLASGEIINATSTGIWDVTFMPVDEERKKTLDFGAPYHVLQSTYLAAAGSVVKTVAEANAPGVRIGGVANTATFRASQKASPLATHITMAGVDDAVAAIRDGKTDLIALSRESLVGVAPKIPGSRVLDGAILSSSTAVAVPKNKPAALAYVTAFMEEEKAAGNVRRYLDAIGLKNATVAPAGMKP
jgi:polar amino acid transport system substrate-binding protein